MPKTFYISADEEVNSVISRLRKSPAKRNVLIVSRRALILQSSVSLRLIKSEMDALDKKVLIVTQDEQGASLAKKIGFPVRTSTEGLDLDDNDIGVGAGVKQSSPVNSSDVHGQVENMERVVEKRNRLKNLGSEKFVSVSGIIKKPPKESGETKKKRAKQVFFGSDKVAETVSENQENQNQESVIDDLKLDKENEFRDLFVETKDSVENDVKKKKEVASGSAKKFIWLFLSLITILFVGVAGYLFFPKAEVKVYPKKVQKDVNLDVRAIAGGGDVDLSGSENGKSMTIPAKVIEKEDTLSLTFQSSGDKVASSKKARGKITIYNEFSEASQVLVATTRFLTEDGKLYRLTRTVVVPGMSVGENGEKQPGKVEAEVVADKAGEEYNIGPSRFSIPGFEGGPKYDKFYAESTQPMRGGGSDTSELRTITKDDISKAEQETLSKAKEQLLEKMKNDVGDGKVILTKAVKYEVLDSNSFPEEGAVSDNFEYQVKLKGTAIYFDETVLNDKINKYIESHIVQEEKTYPMEIVSVDKKIDNVDADFSNSVLRFNVSLNVSLRAKINTDEIVKEMSGKNQQEVDELISKHPEIQKIEAFISPKLFATRMPKYESRISVKVEE